MPAAIPEHIIKAYQWLRAEVFCAGLEHAGTGFGQLQVIHAGAFRKSYRNDIEQVKTTYNKIEQQPELAIKLNRDGVYDRLPEGVFHQTRGNTRVSNVNEMKEEHRRFKEEEKLARKFFQPLEQEFFRYSLLAEQAEQQLELDMLQGNLADEWQQIWEVDQTLPRRATQVLLRIMPWAHIIKGDMQLTARALALMLDKPVTASAVLLESQEAPAAAFMLGQSALGEDTVSGARFDEPVEVWHFAIEQLEPAELAACPPAASIGKFLKQFEEIFIPLTADIKFDYRTSQTTSAATADKVLGYGWTL